VSGIVIVFWVESQWGCNSRHLKAAVSVFKIPDEGRMARF
jgi:hypothetical protein